MPPPMGPVTHALIRAIKVANSVMGGTAGLQAQMQKMHYNKNAHMHTAHTHTHTPQAERNHRSKRDLRFSKNESTQARTGKQARQTRQCAAPHGSGSCHRLQQNIPTQLVPYGSNKWATPATGRREPCTNTYGRCLPSFRQCLLNVKKTVPSGYATRHLCEHRWCWPGGLTLGVPSGRNAWAG